MSGIPELAADGTLTLPGDVRRHFRPADCFLVWAEGVTVHLKRLMPLRLAEVVPQEHHGAQMSLDEIAEGVRQYRTGNA